MWELQTNRCCFKCGTTENLHHHEVFYGAANRKKSIKYHLQVYLCGKHHNLSSEGVHFDKEFDAELKDYAQRRFEEEYSHEKFISIFHKNYIKEKNYEELDITELV